MAGASEGAGGGGNKDDIAVVKLAMASAAIASIGVHQKVNSVALNSERDERLKDVGLDVLLKCRCATAGRAGRESV
jgi:hypothetical protein